MVDAFADLPCQIEKQRNTPIVVLSSRTNFSGEIHPKPYRAARLT
jgi:hypothetical protein